MPECFVTIATGIAQNPCLKALCRIPAWASFYLALSKYNVGTMPHPSAIMAYSGTANSGIWPNCALSGKSVKIGTNIL